MLEVKRTLVKSGPELWAEVSDPEALSGHLAPFGEIRITRTDSNSLVAWEGERGTGQVVLEPSGFGTRVVLRAEPRLADDEAAAALTAALDQLSTAAPRPFAPSP